MNYTQIKPFNQAQGGTTPDMCLANITAGYGIPNKYGSAWEAWQNTQQHADRNVPTGVDVPIYYSYTATIDGVTENYGHINVQLANGTVWSDGNIYPSIDAYLANRLPKYVGWGESVNDVTVISPVNQGGDMPITKEQEEVVAQLATGYNPGKDYNSTFVDTTNLDGMLQFWYGQANKMTEATENALAVMQTGSLPGKDYNYPNVGTPMGGANTSISFWYNQPRGLTNLKPYSGPTLYTQE